MASRSLRAPPHKPPPPALSSRPMPRLHVPQPPTRPGDKPDFSYVDLSPAGAIPKPDVHARARDMEEVAVGLVRVLDDKHEAVGQWNPQLDPEDLQVGLRHMLLTRIFD